MQCKRFAAALLAAICLLGVTPLQASGFDDAGVKAPAAVLMEAQTGKVLYEKAPHEQRPCASVTKVMTLLLVMEAIDSGTLSLTDSVAASAHAASMGGSDIWLKEGEVMSVDNLIKATVVASANDAAVVLAERVAGSEDAFVQKMNEKAKALGMKDTVFKNCNGLDEDGHVTSAYDVAVMSRMLIQHKEIFRYTTIWMDNVRDGATQLVNTNKLLKSYQGITGLKTGTTSKAGSCISATAERDGMSLIASVLGAGNTDDRFSTARTLLDYGFAGWSMVDLPQPEQALAAVPVANGMLPEVSAHADLTGKVLVPKGKEGSITCTVEMQSGVKAPVQAGQQLGRVQYTLGEEPLCTRPVVAGEAVEAISFSRLVRLLGYNLFYI